MKKLIIFLSMILSINLVACSSKEREIINQEPQISQIRSICNLATLECYYHNVARSEKEGDGGILLFEQKDREFWIEYTGVAKIGIDMTKVVMQIEGENVTISMPEAQVLSINVLDESLNEESYIFSKDNFFNENKITANDQTNAIQKAQADMEEKVKNNSALLLSAQNRAKCLIENYINQLGDVSGVEYKISWNYTVETEE